MKINKVASNNVEAAKKNIEQQKLLNEVLSMDWKGFIERLNLISKQKGSKGSIEIKISDIKRDYFEITTTFWGSIETVSLKKPDDLYGLSEAIANINELYEDKDIKEIHKQLNNLISKINNTIQPQRNRSTSIITDSATPTSNQMSTVRRRTRRVTLKLPTNTTKPTNTTNTTNIKTTNNEQNWSVLLTRKSRSIKPPPITYESNNNIKNSIKRKYADSILRALDKIAGSKNNKNMNLDNINARKYLKQEAMNNLIKLIENYPNQDQLGKILKNSKSKLRGTNININTLRNLYREVEPFSKKSGGYTRR